MLLQISKKVLLAKETHALSTFFVKTYFGVNSMLHLSIESISLALNGTKNSFL